MKYTNIEHEKLESFIDMKHVDKEEINLMEWIIIDSEGNRYRLWKFLIVIL